MKREMTSHFRLQAQALSVMRDASMEGFNTLRTEIGDLKEKLGEADQTHKSVSPHTHTHTPQSPPEAIPAVLCPNCS